MGLPQDAEKDQLTYERALQYIADCPSTVLPISFVYRNRGGARAVVELFRITQQVVFHIEEGVQFAHWTTDPNRYLQCALRGIAQLACAGLTTNELEDCQVEVFKRLFRVGAQAMATLQQARLQENERKTKRLDEEQKSLEEELRLADAQFLLTTEALFRASLTAQATDSLQWRLAMRSRLEELHEQRQLLANLRAQILKLQKVSNVLVKIQRVRDFLDAAEAIENHYE